jgi:hypothetical protein
MNSKTGDLLWGCKAIADAIERTERDTFHLLETGAIPSQKVGGKWCASRARLLAYCAGDVIKRRATS